jgi:hypothetical protein
MSFTIDLSRVLQQQAEYQCNRDRLLSLRRPLGVPTAPPPPSALPVWARRPR